MDPRRDGSAALRRSWRDLVRTRNAGDPLLRWPAYQQFFKQFHEEYPDDFISAGVNFGTLQICVDEAVDLAAPGLGVIVLRASVFERLIAMGLGIEGWRVNARYDKSVTDDCPYMELVAKPIGRASQEQGITLCPLCMRSDFTGKLSNRWEWVPANLDTASIPEKVDVFRIVESPTSIVASERFVEAVAECDCGNLEWKPLATK